MTTIIINEEIDLIDGYSAQQIFQSTEGMGITFDDLIILPGQINFGVQEVILDTKITKNISLKVPLCSSPMDTVTEDRMAISMALGGAIGFLHCDCTISEQVDRVQKVKRYENGNISIYLYSSYYTPITPLINYFK